MRDFATRVERWQKRVEWHFMPQTATIYIPEVTFDDYGARDKVNVTEVLYKGSSSIPCRLDVSKHYRQADIMGTEVMVSEFTIHLPRSVVPPLDAEVVVEDVAYQIRKLEDQQAWDTTTKALMVRVNTLDAETDGGDFLTDGGDEYLIVGEGDLLEI